MNPAPLSSGIARLRRPNPTPELSTSSLEPLEARIAPAFVATLTAVLVLRATMTGDDTSEILTITSDGAFLLHNRFDAGDPGFASSSDFDTTLAGVQSIPVGAASTLVVDLGGGDDQFSASVGSPPVRVFGGTGNDVLLGSSFVDFLVGGPGHDILFGGRDNDVLVGGDGDDQFTWNPGDGSDDLEGGAGHDALLFNGANIAELFEFQALDGRLRFTRDIANITMLASGVENFDLIALGGADTITVGDLSSTEVENISLHLAAFGAPDGAVDKVIVNGTFLDDDIRARGSTGVLEVTGLRSLVQIDGFEPTDQLSVSGGLGIDNVIATPFVGANIALTLDGETNSTELPTFALGAPAGYDVGANPAGIAVGDLIGLGHDLVVVNAKSNSLTVLLNLGDGTFAASPQLSTGGLAPKSVVFADVNGDHRLDLAVTNSGSGTVAVLVNNGDGTFADAVPFPIGKKPGLLRAADVNGDGSVDLVAITAGNKLSILTGDGDAGFGKPATLATGGKVPVDFLFADFNGDGRGDIAVAHAGSNNVTILPSAPNLTFGAPESFRVGVKPTALAVGDFNGDGRADLVVSHGISRFLSILLNSSLPGALAPTFLAQLKLANPGSNIPSAIAVGDLNQDGRADIVVANAAAGTVGVFLNIGGASFRAPIRIDLDNFPPRRTSSLVLADLNLDGRVDIATANAGTGDLTIIASLRG